MHRKPIYRGNCLKVGGRGLGQFADLKGGLPRRRGWCFLRGVDTPNAHYKMHQVLIKLRF